MFDFRLAELPPTTPPSIYEVAGLLSSRLQNVLDFDLVAGWFASALTSTSQRFSYGDTLRVMAQPKVALQIEAGGRAVLSIETTKTDQTCEIFDQRREYDLGEENQTGRA